MGRLIAVAACALVLGCVQYASYPSGLSTFPVNASMRREVQCEDVGSTCMERYCTEVSPGSVECTAPQAIARRYPVDGYGGGGGGGTYVHGYYRRNGTYVSGYTRRR